MGILGKLFKSKIDRLRERGDVEGLVNLLEETYMKSRYKKVDGFITTYEYKKADSKIISALVEIGKRGVKPLLKAFESHQNASFQEPVIDVFKKIGELATEMLIKQLDDDDVSVRRAAINILGEIGDKRAVKPLIESLKDKDNSVRLRSVRSLGRFGSDAHEAIVPLKKLYVEYINHKISSDAIDALEKIGGKKERKLAVNEAALSKFAQWTSVGVCDVCGKPLRLDAAFKIPVDRFYSSPKYNEWFKNNKLLPKLTLERVRRLGKGRVDLFQLSDDLDKIAPKVIADMRSKDKTPYSAVCDECVELFL